MGTSILSKLSSWASKISKSFEREQRIDILRDRTNIRIVLHLARGALDKPPLELCEENAQIVIDEVKKELGTIFGYDKGSRDVGITGEIELVELDGPAIIVSLKGRFWHATDTVMLRVESFIKNRIPEVTDVILNREKSQIVDDNRLNTEPGGKKLF